MIRGWPEGMFAPLWTTGNVISWSLGWGIGGLLGERLGGIYSFALASATATFLESLLLALSHAAGGRWLVMSLLGIASGGALSFVSGLPIGVPILVLCQGFTSLGGRLQVAYMFLIGLAGTVMGGAGSTSVYLALGGRVGALPSQGPSGPLLGFLLGAIFGLVYGAFRAFGLGRLLDSSTSRAG